MTAIRACALRRRASWRWSEQLPDALARFAVQISDSSPRVRLEAIQGLCRVPSAEAVQIGMRALDQSLDPILEFALQKLAILHKARWQPLFQAGQLTFDGNARRTAFALKAIKGDAVATLIGLIQKEQVGPENLGDVLQLIALLGNADAQGAGVSSTVRANLVDIERPHPPLGSAYAGNPRAQGTSGGDLKRIAQLCEDSDPRLASAALRLAGAWKLEAERRAVLQVGKRSESGRPAPRSSHRRPR